jgi:tetratricopeptide (TPR) repeat protein
MRIQGLMRDRMDQNQSLKDIVFKDTGRDHPQRGPAPSYRSFFILLFLVFIVYSNTFRASWHLDDYPSIVENQKIQLPDLTLDSIHRSLQHPQKETLWRPLAHLSFALNWYAGRDDVFGYHLVNVMIHLLSSCLLYLTISTLFRTPNLQSRYSGTSHFISLLATVLWMINPIQTQAVTYIVQRMTLLASLFFITGIYCYLLARLTGSRRQRIVMFMCCAASFLLGISAKENAALLPLTIIVIEAIFFQNLTSPQVRIRLLAFLAVGGLAIVILGGLIFFKGDLLSVFSGYGDRFFTPSERLMTQPRVLFFYLTLIFCPLPERLSIDHDFVLSTSLLHPWTTLPAFVLVVAVIVGALFQARKRPLLSFAVLFFFLNHIVESSIIPLEMVFEHRNYLPSMFLFVLVAEGVVWLLDRHREKQPILNYGMIGLLICLMIGFGWGTYVRNDVWRTEISLWSDAYRKAPMLHRPLHNLAMARYEVNGQLEKALELYQKAAQFKMHRRSHRARLYGNIANIYYRTGDLHSAEVYFKKAVDLAPLIEDSRYRLAETLYQQQKWQPALANLSVLLDKNPNSYDYLVLMGKILISCNDSVKALRYLRAAIRINSKRPEGPTYAGVALMKIKAYDRSVKLFKFALNLEPKDLLTYLRLVDVNLRRGHLNAATALIRYIVTSATINDIDASLGDLSREPFYQGIEFESLKRVIATELENHIPGASSRFLQNSNN